MTVSPAACCCALALLLLPVVNAFADETRPEKLWVYVGTYTGGPSGSKGIYRLELDVASGKLSEPQLAAEVTSPSFLAIHPTRRFLYAVGEIGDFGGKKSGAVSALALNPKTGGLRLLNQEPSGGAGPCHLTVDRAGKHVLVANYTGGSASVLPIGDDGRLGKATAFQQHAGSSANPQRQEGPHAHCTAFDAANRFAFVVDLGLDKVLIYRYDATAGTLTPNDPPAAATAPGAGPRHITFHPDGKYGYVIDELDSTVTVFDYAADRGALTKKQVVTTLPKDFKGRNYPAEVQAHPTGKFLYGSNRGHDSIAVFTIDARTGELTPAGHQGHRIKNPRNFGIDPTGTWMLVANQDSDSLVVFRIDPKTGALEPQGEPVAVPKPVCVKMLPVTR